MKGEQKDDDYEYVKHVKYVKYGYDDGYDVPCLFATRFKIQK